MQLFESFAQSLSLKDSYSKIVNALKTILSMSSGTTFPTTELQVGMLCYRTDQKKLYLLTQDTPSATWLALFDLSSGSAIALAAASVAWSGVTGKPTTLAGYGISDATKIFGGCTTDGVVNWNDVSNTRPGHGPTLLPGNAPNGPGPTTYFHVLNFEYSSANGTGNVTQFAISYSSPGDQIWFRGRHNNVWTAWRRCLTNLDQTGTWGISISGNAATASTAAACSGNAATATTAISCTGTLDSLNASLCVGRSGGVIRGQVYNDASGMGFLDNGGGWAARVNYGSKDWYVWGNVTAYSDESVKTNWRSFGEGFVHQLAEVKSGTYDRTDCELTQVGVSAQSLRKIMPHAVTEHREEGSEDVSLSVAYGNAALAACVELAKAVTRLEARVKELEARQ